MTGRSRTPVRRLRQDLDTRPFLVIWEVTRACDLVCVHCRAEAIPDRDPLELTTAEGRHLLDRLAAYGPPYPLVVLTGGDPFARDDLAELVAHASARGLSVALAPSVTPRMTRRALDELREAGAKAVSLSLDGATAATHDGFRGVDGVFDATLEAARWVREAGFRLQINTTVTRATVDDLPGILRHVGDLDAFLWSVFLLVGTGRGRELQALGPGGTEDVLHALYDASSYVRIKTTEAPMYRRVVMQRNTTGARSPGEVAELFGLGDRYRRLRSGFDGWVEERQMPERTSRPPLDVNAGRGFAFVSHTGTVTPSGFLPLPAGSVRDRPFREIYADAPLMRRLRRPETFGGRCGRCEFREVCGGSRSRAYAASGDAFAEDPACPYEPARTAPLTAS